MKISYAERKHIPIPRGHGLAYRNYDIAVEVYYPIPINYIVRYCRDCLWQFLTVFHWVGLIDKCANEAFRWHDFFRIKLHN